MLARALRVIIYVHGGIPATTIPLATMCCPFFRTVCIFLRSLCAFLPYAHHLDVATTHCIQITNTHHMTRVGLAAPIGCCAPSRSELEQSGFSYGGRARHLFLIMGCDTQ